MKSRIELIEFDGEHYLADLDHHKLFLADEMSQEVFELFESQTEEQIVLALSDRYPEQDINNCIQWFHQLFERSPIKSLEQPQLKIFAPTPYSSRSRLKSQTLGASVAHIEFLKALSKYAQIHVTQEFDGIDNMVLIPFNPNDRASASMIIKEKYDGVLLSYLDNFEMMPFLSYLYTPVVLPVYTARGDNGRIANGMLRWYASMRSFDAFMVLSQPTIDLYSTFIQDTSLFHIVPCGVDTEFFHPMNKETAKGKVAKLLNIPEISQKQIVGYVSRFQVEKGAGIFVDIAKLMPDTMFLAVGTISDPDHHNFPPNLIHIGVRPREELPVLYSAFDVFCFPSIACSEEFGLVVLEAMACGTVPVVSSYDGPKYFVKDAGVIVEATTYDRDLADLGCGVSAYDFAESITDLLHNDLNRQAMAEKARQYALELTWDNSARCLLQLFQKLNLKKRLIKRANHLPVGFSLSRSPDGNVRPKSIIINAAKEHNAPLVGWLYDTSIEEGIALALLQNHNMREIEAILSYLLQEPDLVAKGLDRVKRFLEILF